MSAAYVPLNLTQLIETSKESPIEYLVDGLFPNSTLNLIVGKPKSGKSTLVRQLAACVSNGADFLGRTTTKGDVLYFASEEIGAHVAEHFNLLGVEPNAGIYTVLHRPGPNFIVRLSETLKQMPSVRLVILDPLIYFIPDVDLDSYVQVAPAMADLVDVAEKNNVVILTVHHSKKRATDEVGDSILGSSAIVAAMFTTLFLNGEMGSVRKIRSAQRYGTRLEFTELAYTL